MAIVLFGPLVTGIRGTVAGLIFSANKGGPFARAWQRGPNTRSPTQSDQRRITSDHAQGWRNLTQVQRDAWDVWAALPAQEKTNSLGEAYYISGFNWFVAINSRLTNMARANRVLPPVAGIPASPTISSVVFRQTAGAPLSTVNYPNGEFAGFDMVLFAAISSSHGVLTKTQGWRVAKLTQNPGPAAQSFQPGLEAAFGDIYLLQRGFIRLARQTSDGERSAFAQDFANVT